MSQVICESSVSGRLGVLARDIKLSHTVFAMPFALFAAVLAGRGEGRALAGKLGLIVACMVLARTVAMAANRLLDAELDARNPRTAGRAIPSGALSRQFVLAAAALCGIGFLAVTGLFWLWWDNLWPVVLSVPVLALLAGYPLLKRFTRWCHYYLGMALGLAPVCAWVAVRGGLDWPPVWMGLAVLLWTAGFDIIYATQDSASDVATGVFSIPARLGIGPALWVSRLTHAAAVGMLVMLGYWCWGVLGPLYFGAVGVVAVLLVVEHGLVRPGDLSRVGVAFFTINGAISLLLGAVGIADVLL